MVAYGGTLEFTLGAFTSDVNELNQDLHLVEIECKTCDFNRGKRIAFPVSSLAQALDGETTTIKLGLRETDGWLLDPKNVLLSWTKPSTCDMIQVLAGISSLRILGDFTRWYETIGLDNVALRNDKSKLPLCAQRTADISLCNCGY